MSFWDYKPGVNKIEINTNLHDNKEEYLVDLKFELNGLNRLKAPVELGGEFRNFFIYIFLIYYDGGKNFEIVTSAQHFTRLNNLDEKATFRTTFLLPSEHPYEPEDFIQNYYTAEIHYAENQAQYGSDVNMMLGNAESTLFSSKINFEGSS